MPVYISPPPRNPLAQLFAAVVGVLAMAGAFIFGLVALAVVAGIAAVIGMAAWIYGWRLRRQMRRHQASRPRHEADDVIEAEYTVISRKSDSS